ncbi:hypothetical protein DV495_001661 [Geotrichum candidum]|nr:hypothetical protein DV495_001661 [Geotrichum candidum]
MSHASVSSLPSSFAMVLFTISLKYLVDYLSAETNRARATAISSGLFAVVVGGVLGWPFVLALAPAWALHYLYISFKAVSSAVEKKKQVKGGKPIDEKKGIDETQALDLTPYRAFFNSTLSVIKASVILIVIIVGIDAVAYRKIEFVPLNIVLYNVIHASADSGPNIFGTEPWYYYLANLALNFNIALPLALAAPIALPFSSIKKKRQALLLVLPFFLWLAIFTAQPHKEERFMYIVYGSLAVNAAVSIDAIMQVGSRVLPRWPWIGKIVVAAVLMVYAALSVMRTSALISYYGAPMKVYDKVHELTPQVPTADGGKYSNVCVGREWYRFPSSYFLRDDQRLKFIASGFDGLLPGEFAEGGDGLHDWRFGTHVVPSGMNNRNEADPSKLVPVSACDYIVDTDLDTAPGETRFTRDEEHWKKVVCEPFLDAGASRGIARQLKIPTALHKFTKILPSSFAMILFNSSLLFLVGYLSSETNRDRATGISGGLFSIVVGGVLGWPFVLVFAPFWVLHYIYITFKAVPPAVDEEKKAAEKKPIDEKKGIDETQTLDLTPSRAFFNSTLSVIKASVILIAIIVGIDAVAYRKIEFVRLNTVLYNVIHASADSAPSTFEAKPWYYYFANLALNFNIALPLALAAPIALPFSSIKKKRQALLLVLPFFLWLAIFTVQPHKEEQFMYVVYGLLAVSAAVTVDAIKQVVSRASPRWPWIGKIVVAAVLMVYAALSVMRTSALISYYGAPLNVYDRVRKLTPPVPTASGGKYSNICVGREWHRFPSSFFLRDDQRLKFIASGFDGLLPGEFAEGGNGVWDWRSGTHVVPSGMNNHNEADPNKLVPISACDYIVDTDLDTAPGETRFTRDEEHWKKVVCKPFLDPNIWFGIRSGFGIISGLAEASLYIFLHVSKLFGSNIALAYIIISSLSPGMGHASVSALPSSFAMVLFNISLSCFVLYLSINSNRNRATGISGGLFAIVVGGVLGWPFVLVLAPSWVLHYIYITFKAVPPAVDEEKKAAGKKPIDEKKGIDETQTLDLTPYRAFFKSVVGVIKASVILIAIVVGIDAVAYRKIEFVRLNTVLYNVIYASADSAPSTFEAKPWYYYFANLALNFNIALPLALAAPIALPFSSIKKKRQALLLVLPFFLWLAIFTVQPHKEEQFMYVVYGSLAVSAAVTVDAIKQVVSRASPRWPWIGKIVVAAVLMVYAALSVMRTSALISYYRAPLKVYDSVRKLTPPVPTASGGKYSNICVGREWHRFPSSFFLRDDQRLKFIASGFDGLLPGEFAEGGNGVWDWRSGTHVVPSGMNNRNEADPSKLVPVSACDYIVDTDLDTAPGETRFTRDEEHWKKVVCKPFLDASASRGIARQLKIPKSLYNITQTIGWMLAKISKARSSNTAKKSD